MLGFDVTVYPIGGDAGHTVGEVEVALTAAGLLETESPVAGMKKDPVEGSIAFFRMSAGERWLDTLVQRGAAGKVGTGGYPDRYWTRFGDASPHIPPTVLTASPADDDWVLIDIFDLS